MGLDLAIKIVHVCFALAIGISFIGTGIGLAVNSFLSITRSRDGNRKDDTDGI